MKALKQISTILLAMIFLISSSGFIMYKSFCLCTGNKQVSVFVQNKICSSKGIQSCCEEKTKSCASESSDCDCGKPEITYIKLTNTILEKEIQFTKVEPTQMLVVYAFAQFNLWVTEELVNTESPYIDPPPIYNSSQEFLISIQQLKIPSIA